MRGRTYSDVAWEVDLGGETVYACQPREVDPPHKVAENRHELEMLVGEEISLEQCDECGCNIYTIVKQGASFYAQCSDDGPARDAYISFRPCGTLWPIRLALSDQVVH